MVWPHSPFRFSDSLAIDQTHVEAIIKETTKDVAAEAAKVAADEATKDTHEEAVKGSSREARKETDDRTDGNSATGVSWRYTGPGALSCWGEGG